MDSNKKLKFEPYSSISVPLLKEAGGFLENILLSDYKFQTREINKPIIIYGAGSLGKMAKDFFSYLNIPFLYVVDQKASQYKGDECWENIEIISPDDVSEKDKKNSLLVICVVTTPLIALRDELKNNGWKDIAFFYDISENYRHQHPLNNGWFLGKLNGNDKKSIKTVFSFLADDISQAFYVQFLAWRKLRIELLFNNLEINNDNRFFISEITDKIRENEIFVDCGAHKGSVIEKFLKLVNNKYEAVWAIEPDNLSFEILKTGLTNLLNFKIIKCALSDKKGKEKFYQGFGFASKLSEYGNDIVNAITLDSLNVDATFIKMHLEGGELKAIIGAQQTIKKNRPILAITLYHNRDGAWQTPLFLMNLFENYKFYFRLHSWAGTGAVLYAIPKERSW